jgi:peptidoglycan hydrolase-like protein with peptidoglycan-binding domain
MASEPYVIRQGDFLSKLAQRRGFDADTVWNDPQNADLKQSRSSYDVLSPGDLIYLPVQKPTTFSLSVGSENNFTVDVPLIDISITLTDDDEPVKNAACHVLLEGSDTPIDTTTDGDGLLKFQVPMDCDTVTLTLDDPPASYTVRIGHMDPDNEPAGVALRLTNLGYIDDPNASGESLADAVRAFQADAGIAVTGEVDDPTRDALVKAHGH